MTKEQSQKLAMYMAVLRVLRNRNTQLESAPALETLIAELERLVAEIQHTVSRRGYFREGFARAKSVGHDELVRLTFTVSSAIRAWAAHTGDAQRALRHSRSWSTFRQMRQVALPAQVEGILAEARELGAVLEPFGVSAGLLDALEAARSRFLDLVAQPREAVVNHRAATAVLAGLFAEADALLKERIDQLLNAMRGTEFYSGYQGARRLAGARRNPARPADAAPDAAPAPPTDPATVGLTAFRPQAGW